MVVNLFTKFQFHYGSVKRLHLDSILFKIKQFQFHYGSVKSLSISMLMSLV